jgi:hypothetical protein
VGAAVSSLATHIVVKLAVYATVAVDKLAKNASAKHSLAEWHGFGIELVVIGSSFMGFGGTTTLGGTVDSRHAVADLDDTLKHSITSCNSY